MIHPSELTFFTTLVKAGSLSAAARELGLTTSSVSKRLAQMEERLGVILLNRTTRRLSLTDEGEIYLADAGRILHEIEDMERRVTGGRAVPRGVLRVNAPLGFGRSYVAPIVSRFVRQFPEIEVQLQLTDHPVSLVDGAFDIGIRFGELPDSRLVARRIAANRRLVCAAPSYLRKYGEPRVPHDLGRHQCIVLRQNDAAYGSWRFTQGRSQQTVKVRGMLSSNDGEVTLNWALDGLGITLRAEWDIAKYLRSGRLKLLLEDYATPSADIYAVYSERHNLSPKVQAFVDFMAASFAMKGEGGARRQTIW